jgi:hypothetical protein
MKNQLLLSRNDLLFDDTKSDVLAWHQIFKLINLNVSLVDRCDKVVMPYNFKNEFPMPKDLLGFNKSYNDICVERAREIITRSRELNKPILILYSGGIDSTAVVISFLIAAEGDLSNIEICLNTYSIRENPNFYYKHIRGKFKLVPSENMLNLLNGEYILVGGDFNDQLFGSDLYQIIINYKDVSYLYENYSRENIVAIFEHVGMDLDSANLWYTLVDEQIRETNLCEIKKVKDFFWWLNFSYKWQSVYFRLIARSTNRDILNKEFLDTYCCYFFNTVDFQKWSMLNPDKKIKDTWTSYKITTKEFILDYTKDQEYFDFKTKLGSLSKVFTQRDVPDAILSNYSVIYNIDPKEFYLHNNSFKK